MEVEQGLQDARDSVRSRSNTAVTTTIVTSLKKLALSLFLRVPEGCAPCWACALRVRSCTIPVFLVRTGKASAREAKGELARVGTRCLF